MSSSSRFRGGERLDKRTRATLNSHAFGSTYSPRYHDVHERQLDEAEPAPLIRAVHCRRAILEIAIPLVAADGFALLEAKLLRRIFLRAPEAKGLGAAGGAGELVEDAAARRLDGLVHCRPDDALTWVVFRACHCNRCEGREIFIFPFPLGKQTTRTAARGSTANWRTGASVGRLAFAAQVVPKPVAKPTHCRYPFTYKRTP